MNGSDASPSSLAWGEAFATWPGDEASRLGGRFWKVYAIALSVGALHGAIAAFGGLLADHRVSVAQGGQLKQLMFVQQIATACALAYLVILRTSKVDEYLRAAGTEVSSSEIEAYIKFARPYYQAISGGLWRNIIIGSIFVALTVYAHERYERLWGSTERKRDSVGRHHPIAGGVAFWVRGFARCPAWFRLACGFGILGMVAPPPSPTVALQVAAVVVGLMVIKAAAKDLKWLSS